MRDIRLFEYALTDSTNTRAKEAALADIVSPPALFIADEQTCGRGRMGRSFYSPKSTGLYATLLFNAPDNNDRLLSLTALAAVAALEAIEAKFGIKTDIKWVNDLYLNGKKVAGILAESFPVGKKRMIIVGIGINLSTSMFPDELRDKASSLGITRASDPALKRELALDFAERLLDLIELGSLTKAMQKYRDASCVIGKKIRFAQGNNEIAGIAENITDSGALILSTEDQEKLTLASGEISILFD